jgi:predicted XRE-type DNA-binding protein
MKSSVTENIEDKRVTLSSGNVFADLGFENPEQMILKAELVREISAAIKEKGLNAHQAGEVLGLEVQKVTDLVKGRFGEYSIERLFQYMNALDRDLEIVVKPRSSSEEKSGVRVTVVGAIACP